MAQRLVRPRTVIVALLFATLGVGCGGPTTDATAPLPDLENLGRVEHFPRNCPEDGTCIDRVIIAHTTVDSVAAAFEGVGYLHRDERDGITSMCVSDREDRCAFLHPRPGEVLLYLNVAADQSAEDG